MADIEVTVSPATVTTVSVPSLVAAPSVLYTGVQGPPGADGSSGNSFDQSLNTTDSPTFSSVHINDGNDGYGVLAQDGISGRSDNGHAGNWGLSKNAVIFNQGDDAGPATAIVHGGITYNPNVSLSATPLEYSFPSASGTIALTNDIPTLPSLGTASALDVPATGNASSSQVVKGDDSRLTDSRTPSAHTHPFTQISGRLNVAQLPSTVPILVNGLIPSTNLPSYVDDVLEYSTTSNFPDTGETGKIYVATGTGLIYRWTGSIYVEISPSTAQIQSDWNASSGLGVILNKPTLFSESYTDLSNKPTLGTAASKDIPVTGNASATQVVYGSDTRLTDARTATSHATTHATGGSDALTASDIGAVPNDASTSFGGKFYSRTGLPTTATSPINTAGVWAFYKNTQTVGTAAGDVRLYVNDAGTLKFLQFQTQPFATIATTGSATDLSTGVLPDARLSSSVVTLDATQTLTNKSISSGQITGLGTAAAKDIPASGNASATQVVYGSDTRLTDTRIPSAHTHPLSDLTQSSATTGQVATWNGTVWAAATPASSTDASALTTGTLADARLSSNVTLLTSSQTLTNKTLTTPSVGNGSTTAILTAYSANILSVANSTTACGFSVFNTRDAGGTNYEAGIFDFTTNANSLTIGTVKGGTGTARRVRINSAEQIDFYCTDTSRMFQVSTSAVTSFNAFGFQWFSSASDPTTSSTPFSNGTSYCAVYKNTTSGVVSLWVRDGSTMKKVALA
jgi:hypothetical protein